MRRKLLAVAVTAPEELAELARLRYVNDQEDGFTRHRNGRGFVYVNMRSIPLRDARKIKRIEQLAIPPAWREVWICRFSDGHLQATGRDDRERKQYLYHPRWREISNLAKFWRLKHFGRVLPKLRSDVARDLAGEGLTRERVLAGMIALLDATSIRVGNEEYVRENNSYGLTTLRNRHVRERDGNLKLRFRAKGGFQRELIVEDPRLIRLIDECRKLVGAHLFQYVTDDGAIRAVDAIEVNDYLREVTCQPFTAKDFRTWKASAEVAEVLFEHPNLPSLRQRKKVVKAAISAAAESLGNTTTVSRQYYIHPALLESYERGNFDDYFRRFKPRRRKVFAKNEQILMRFLNQWEVSFGTTPMSAAGS
jgi:DNA topoisomerase-1